MALCVKYIFTLIPADPRLSCYFLYYKSYKSYFYDVAGSRYQEAS